MNTKTGTVDSTLGFASHGNTAVQHGQAALHQGKDKLLLDLKTVADDAQALLKEAVDASAETFAGVPAYLEQRLGTVKGNLQRVRSTVEMKAKRATAVTDQYVHENPWKLMVAAAVVGVLVGIMVVGACIPALRKVRESAE